MSDWFVYILECSDGTFYTGITKSIERRLSEHNEGEGAKYTRGRTPVKLLYTEKCKNRSEATTRESEIKGLKREEKEKLIGYNK